ASFPPPQRSRRAVTRQQSSPAPPPKGSAMSTTSVTPPGTGDTGTVERAAEPRRSLGLGAATALIVGSIIGVGIFNLPTSLAAYGPISLIAMALTTVGALSLAVLFAALSKRL